VAVVLAGRARSHGAAEATAAVVVLAVAGVLAGAGPALAPAGGAVRGVTAAGLGMCADEDDACTLSDALNQMAEGGADGVIELVTRVLSRTTRGTGRSAAAR
jgi:hypothetical protein